MFHREGGTIEGRADSAAQEEGTEQAIENEEAAIHGLAKYVTRLALKLVGHCLKHKTEQNQHPNPIGTAKTGAIEEGEGGEEGTAEGDEGREGQFPFASGGTNDEFAFFLISSEAEDEAVGALHEHQEDEEAAEEAH